jgi:hypothetical protein
MKLAPLLLASLMFLSCATGMRDDSSRHMDGDSGPLTVDLADFDVARLGSRPPIEYQAQFAFAISNHSNNEVTVKRIGIRQKGLTDIAFESPTGAFNKTIPPNITEQFSVHGRASMSRDVTVSPQTIRLALVVDVLLASGEEYEYAFDVPVEPTSL